MAQRCALLALGAVQPGMEALYPGICGGQFFGSVCDDVFTGFSCAWRLP